MAEIKVLSSIATKEAYLELVPQFESATGHKVSTTWAGTTAIMQRMAAGERYDLIVISSTELDELIRQGKIVAGSRVDLAKSGIGIAVRAGAPRPDVGSSASAEAGAARGQDGRLHQRPERRLHGRADRKDGHRRRGEAQASRRTLGRDHRHHRGERRARRSASSR